MQTSETQRDTMILAVADALERRYVALTAADDGVAGDILAIAILAIAETAVDAALSALAETTPETASVEPMARYFADTLAPMRLARAEPPSDPQG